MAFVIPLGIGLGSLISAAALILDENSWREERERKRVQREMEEEKKRIEKYGWDCKDQPRKPWQSPHVINVAVSGISGVGKSTLVNRLLDLPKGKRARIGVTECTDVIDRITCEPPRQSQQNQGLVVFDLPGCGTDKFPAASYIPDFGLRHFDLVIIVVADRITQADVMLKRELDKFGVHCLVVRNKVDIAVDTNLKQNDILEYQTLIELRYYFSIKGINDPILISAKDKSYEWDMLVNKFNYQKYKFIK